MTKEQGKTIKLLKNFTKMDFSNPMGWTGYYDTELKELSQAVQTVLNMLKEKDREINRKSSTINALQCALHERTEERDRKDNIITKQKKQIDLMAECIDIELSSARLGTILNKNVKPLETYKEDIKQYFKSKAEKE